MLVVAMLLAPEGQAQSRVRPLDTYQHTAWTGEAGPPAGGEHRMARSPDGYLWLSSARGLIRFDGTRFTVVDSTIAPALATALAGEFVPSLVDPAGTMWIAGPGGALLSYRDHEFRRVREGQPGGDGLLAQDSIGLLWHSSGRLHRVRDGLLVDPGLPAGVPDTGVFGVTPDTGRGLWVGTQTQGLWHVSGTGVVRQYGRGRLRALVQGRDGSVWAIGAGLGLGIWRLRGERWTRLHLAGVADDRLISRKAVEARDGSIWFQTPAMGVLRWNASDTLEQFSTGQGLSNHRTHDLHLDPAGAYWVSTDAGMDRLRASMFTPLSRENDLAFDSGYDIEEDESGGLWGASPGSRLLYMVAGGTTRRSPGPVNLLRFDVDDERPFRVLAPARGGGVWVGLQAGGLTLVRESGRQRFGRRDNLPEAPLIRGHAARDGTLWLIDAGGGFGRFRDGRYAPVPIGREPPGITTISEDRTGRLLIWGPGLRCILVVAGDRVVDSVAVPADSLSISSMAVDSTNVAWATTQTGLMRIAGGSATHIALPALRPILEHGAALAISHDRLWIANSSGIARLRRADLQRATSTPPEVRWLDALDGIPFPRTPRPTPHAIRIGADGRVWVSSPSGIYVADADDELRDSAPPRVHIEEVLVADRPLRGSVVPPNPDRVSIRFSSPSLLLPERTRVQYRLDNADEDWVDAPPQRVATYTQLRPGTYQFRLRAWSEAGVPSAGEATLRLRVLPAWYQRWWFYSLCIAAVAGAGSAAGTAWLHARNRRAQERLAARFEAILAERARIARDLHDTLLQGFTGITLHLESIRGKVARLSSTTAEELATVLRSADSTLREAREMVWDMRSPALADADLLTVLEQSARHYQSGDDIEVRCTLVGSPRRLPPSAESTILRVGREALVNALKHAAASRIEITVEYQPRQVVLEVRDNGTGADPSDLAAAPASGHWGVAGMHERAIRAGGSLAVVTAPGQGMSIRLSVPAEPVA